ncbi:MAG: penicillin-binding transpeptidase domain-containing protein [Actinomycetota bacterium]
MNRTIRRVALALGMAFLALFVQLNYVQLVRSRALTEDPRNRRRIIQEYGTRRGEILAGGLEIARSIPSGDSQYRYGREYPLKALFGPITGYYSFIYGATGLERTYNDVMLGREPAAPQDWVDSLLGRTREGNILELTMNPALQRIARAKFGKQLGAAAVVDTETGAVLGLYANPMYDPNGLSEPPSRQAQSRKVWDVLNTNPLRPLTFRATQERYPPGSTFKIITAAAGLENGMKTTTTFPNPRRLNLPDTDKALRNFSGGACAGGGRISMARGFRVSCNTTFAQIAMKIGPTKLEAMATKFGLNGDPVFDIPLVPSCVRAFPGAGCDIAQDLSRPATAYSGIGQQDVRITPLQMALVAATVENSGKVARPYLVSRIRDASGKVIYHTVPRVSKPIYSKATAKGMRAMMADVACRGTGRVVGLRNSCSGKVGGKTGTAQTGVKGEAPHVWFVAWGDGVAVAVVVENGGDLGADATGGRVAGPIAKALLERALKDRSKK